MTQTNLQNIMHKPLSMWVSETVTVIATVLNDSEIAYQFIDSDEEQNIDTETRIAKLEVARDDIDNVDDYSFDIGGMSRYFLHQFSVITEEEIKPVTPKKQLRLAHFPQVPCKPFHVVVESLEEAHNISNVLANYDLFQYENRIKGDYANMTVLEEYDTQEQEWLSWSDEETGIDDLDEYFEYLADMEEA